MVKSDVINVINIGNENIIQCNVNIIHLIGVSYKNCTMFGIRMSNVYRHKKSNVNTND
jgi:hypothetical protein